MAKMVSATSLFHCFPAKGAYCSLSFCLFVSFVFTFMSCANAQSGKTTDPIKVQIITRDQAHYNSPENTLSARISALLDEDLEWFYETLTRDSAEKNRKTFADSNLDPSLMFQMISSQDQLFIIDKFPYKDGIILLVKVVSADGSILIDPVMFTQEDGLWKLTSSFNNEETLSGFTTVIPPESILAADIEFFPSRWHWDEQVTGINKHPYKPDKTRLEQSILCMLGNIRDQAGKRYEVANMWL